MSGIHCRLHRGMHEARCIRSLEALDALDRESHVNQHTKVRQEKNTNELLTDCKLHTSYMGSSSFYVIVDVCS